MQCYSRFIELWRPVFKGYSHSTDKKALDLISSNLGFIGKSSVPSYRWVQTPGQRTPLGSWKQPGWQCNWPGRWQRRRPTLIPLSYWWCLWGFVQAQSCWRLDPRAAIWPFRLWTRDHLALKTGIMKKSEQRKETRPYLWRKALRKRVIICKKKMVRKKAEIKGDIF